MSDAATKTPKDARTAVARMCVSRMKQQYGHRLTQRQAHKRDDEVVSFLAGAWAGVAAIYGDQAPHTQAMSVMAMMVATRGFAELQRFAESEAQPETSSPGYVIEYDETAGVHELWTLAPGGTARTWEGAYDSREAAEEKAKALHLAAPSPNPNT